MRTVRRSLATLALTSALTLGALVPTASAAPSAPVERPQHVSAWLCVTFGGHIVDHGHLRVCIGGLFHGHIVI